MHDFLNAIASGYARDPEVRRYKFVFPNVRSRNFFRERLAAELGAGETEVRSRCLTLAQIVEKISDTRRTPEDKLLYILYRAYRNVRARLTPAFEVESFDRFRYWGQMLLKDFSDVDMYLADAAELFRNVGDYKEIQSFYLTETQERIIRAYWSTDPYWAAAFEARDAATEQPFWNHVDASRKTPARFLQLWALLADLYKEFREILDSTGDAYSAMGYRAAAEAIAANPEDPGFSAPLYVFIGFSRLSHAELLIFDSLRRQGRAHFYWDFDPALMTHGGSANSAGRFISVYAKKFPEKSPYVVLPQPLAGHDVDVVSVSSSVTQAKVAAARLKGDETALVLAEEMMLVPVMKAIPADYAELNVTMGYPMRYSSLAQLYTILKALQEHVVYQNGEPIYAHRDVHALLSLPALRAGFGDLPTELDEYMRENCLYNLPLSHLAGDFEPLRAFFGPLPEGAAPAQVSQYILSAVDAEVGRGMLSAIDAKASNIIKLFVKQIADWSEEFEVETDAGTFFEIIDRALMQRALPLEGETFNALQIMGVEETRSLGFPNVVMLSMTDDIYPGRDIARSFIPESLRRAYGLPTRDHREADKAYHFYRILSHARHLTLVYDGRCGNLRTGEMSRYITQLRYLDFPGVRLHLTQAQFGNPGQEREASIPPGYLFDKHVVAEELRKFADPECIETHRLSASLLKNYLHCPLRFFLETVNGIDIPEPVKVEPGAAEHGSAVHEAAEHIYKHLSEKEGTITAEVLDRLLEGGYDDLLEREMRRAINIHLRNFPATIPDPEDPEKRIDNSPALYATPLDPKDLLYAEAIRTMLLSLFERDKFDAPFEILGLEAKRRFSWRLRNGQTVNFTLVIDRMDRLVRENPAECIIRVIDYKTGSDELDFTVAKLFEIADPKHRSAVFQLLTYCAAYRYLNPEADPQMIRPQIFKLAEVSKPEFELLRFTGSKTVLESYAQVEEEFLSGLEKMFETLFDVDAAAERSIDDGICKYCNFVSVCMLPIHKGEN